MKAAVDNDVLYKGTCYGLLCDLIGAIPANLRDIGILGAARYVVRKKLGKTTLSGNRESRERFLTSVVQSAEILEPTVDEGKFAAELEYVAQRKNLAMDEGESQLFAIVLFRAWDRLVTGDKRAVGAFEQVLTDLKEAARLAGKVICLEQLFLRVVASGSAAAIRDAVCAEPNVDRALSICFSCSAPVVQPESWSEGLRSYVASMRSSAPIILAA
jgi:hypothetical protein